MNTDCAVDSQTCIGPVADPIAVVEVGMTRVAVTDIRFVMAAAGANPAGPPSVTIAFGSDMPSPATFLVLLPVDPGRDVSQSMAIGIDKTMTRCNVARRPDPHQAKGGAARMRFVDALIQLRQGIAHVRETVQFATQSIFKILVGRYVELLEHLIHAAIVNGV